MGALREIYHHLSQDEYAAGLFCQHTGSGDLMQNILYSLLCAITCEIVTSLRQVFPIAPHSSKQDLVSS